MATTTIDWITFSGLAIIVLISFILLLFIILEIPGIFASLPKNRERIGESVVDYLKEQDKQID